MSMDDSSKDPKVVVVISADALGVAIAEAFLKETSRVIICDTNAEAGRNVCKVLGGRYGKSRVRFFQGDVFTPRLLKVALELAMNAFSLPVDVVVNIARMATETDWEKTVDLSLSGAIRGTYAALEILALNRGGPGGTIVNVASTLAVRPLAMLPVYSASNTGVVTFTRCMAHDVHHMNHGVRIMGVCAGPIDKGYTQKDGIWDDPELNQITKTHCNGQLSIEMEEVGSTVVRAVREGKTGSVWQVERGRTLGLVESYLLPDMVEGKMNVKKSSRMCSHEWGQKCDCCASQRSVTAGIIRGPHMQVTSSAIFPQVTPSPVSSGHQRLLGPHLQVTSSARFPIGHIPEDPSDPGQSLGPHLQVTSSAQLPIPTKDQKK